MVFCRSGWTIVFVLTLVFLFPVHGNAEELPENRGWLGMVVEPQKYNDQGVSLLVRSVLDDGPAREAGIREQDVITYINGKVIDFPTNVEFLNFFARIQPGDKIKLSVLRSGENLRIDVVAGVMPREISQALDAFLREAIEHPMSLIPESE